VCVCVEKQLVSPISILPDALAAPFDHYQAYKKHQPSPHDPASLALLIEAKALGKNVLFF